MAILKTPKQSTEKSIKETEATDTKVKYKWEKATGNDKKFKDEVKSILTETHKL